MLCTTRRYLRTTRRGQNAEWRVLEREKPASSSRTDVVNSSVGACHGGEYVLECKPETLSFSSIPSKAPIPLVCTHRDAYDVGSKAVSHRLE
ncbi:hypothetical protein ABKN59_012066 [Abortiporus biennis]